MPNAVQNVGEVEIGGKTIPDFLVVNERVLLFENIGATQQLDKTLEAEKERIGGVDTRLTTLKQTTSQDTTEVNDKIRSIFDILFAEEIGDTIAYAGLEEEYLNVGFSIFKMGPPRSIFVLGFIFWSVWLVGALYICSNIAVRRVMGLANLFMLAAYVALEVCYRLNKMTDAAMWQVQVACTGFGFLLLAINYVRMRWRLRRQRQRALKAKLGEKTGGKTKKAKSRPAQNGAKNSPVPTQPAQAAEDSPVPIEDTPVRDDSSTSSVVKTEGKKQKLSFLGKPLL